MAKIINSSDNIRTTVCKFARLQLRYNLRVVAAKFSSPDENNRAGKKLRVR